MEERRRGGNEDEIVRRINLAKNPRKLVATSITEKELLFEREGARPRATRKLNNAAAFTDFAGRNVGWWMFASVSGRDNDDDDDSDRFYAIEIYVTLLGILVKAIPTSGQLRLFVRTPVIP